MESSTSVLVSINKKIRSLVDIFCKEMTKAGAKVP